MITPRKLAEKRKEKVLKLAADTIAGYERQMEYALPSTGYYSVVPNGETTGYSVDEIAEVAALVEIELTSSCWRYARVGHFGTLSYQLSPM
jgi:hypothetical protein